MSMPAYPSPDNAAAGPAPVAPPASVTMAFQLFMAVAVLSIISVILSFMSLPGVYETALAQARVTSPDLTPEQMEMAASFARVGVIIGAVLVVAVIGLLVLFTFKMRAGRNWARITLTVVGGIAVLMTLFTLVGIGTAIAAGGLAFASSVLSLLSGLLTVAAIVMMFRSDANPYFNRRLNY